MPVLRDCPHKAGGGREDDDGGAQDGRARGDVGEETEEDARNGEDGDKGGAGQDLVLDAEAVVLPLAVGGRLATGSKGAFLEAV
jgi:hypothetical protein